MHHSVTFLDRGREPQCPPDPAFPRGRHIEIGGKDVKESCLVVVPWPAPRCGYWLIKCDKCGTNNLITCAGRPDDPVTIVLPCRPRPKEMAA